MRKRVIIRITFRDILARFAVQRKAAKLKRAPAPQRKPTVMPAERHEKPRVIKIDRGLLPACCAGRR